MASHRPPIRLTTAAGLGASLVVCVGLVGAFGQAAIEKSFQGVLAENVPSLRAAAGLQLALLDQKGRVGNYLLDPSNGEWIEGLATQRAEVETWIAKARGVAFSTPERELVDQIEARFREYDGMRSRVLAAMHAGQPEIAVALQLGPVAEAAGELYEACESLLTLNEDLIADSQRHSQAMLGWLQLLIWATVAAVLALGLLAGWIIARAAGRRLAESERLSALGQLAGSVAHEVRNPLTAIELRLETLRDEVVLSRAGREDLEVIQEEVTRLERIVGNFLGLARHREPQPQPLRLEAVLARAAEILRPSFERQGLRLRQSIQPDLPQLWADSEQMLQVLVNLLLNAAQAMPGGGEIELIASASTDRRGRQQIEMCVRDHGPGIPPAVRSRLFQPFTSTRPDGIGLGLAIVKRIVDGNGGTIQLEDTQGRGTRFRLVLPAAARVESGKDMEAVA